MRRVMLVNELIALRRLMRFLLEFEGYRVVVTDIYEGALSSPKNALSDAALMEALLPGENTIDLVQGIRMLGGGADDTYLVMTSSGQCYLECMEAGVDRYTSALPDEVVKEIECLCG